MPSGFLAEVSNRKSPVYSLASGVGFGEGLGSLLSSFLQAVPSTAHAHRVKKNFEYMIYNDFLVYSNA